MRVQEAVRKLRLQEWALQVQACEGSGLTVREWCKDNGVGYKNYYRRKGQVREYLLNAAEGSSSLMLTNSSAIRAAAQAPVFATIPVSKMNGYATAATVQIGKYIAEINNWADLETVDGVLQTLSRL